MVRVGRPAEEIFDPRAVARARRPNRSHASSTSRRFGRIEPIVSPCCHVHFDLPAQRCVARVSGTQTPYSFGEYLP